MDDAEFRNRESFSNLIGLIYDSAENPELWPELLQQIDHLIDDADPVTASPETGIVPAQKPELGILRSHFQRALQLNRKIYDLKNERDAVSSILDRLPVGVVLMEESLTPVAINRHAEKIIRSGNALSLRDGVLTGSSPAITKEICNAVARAAATTDSDSSGWSLLFGADTSSPCSIHVMPSAHAGIESEKQLIALFIACAGIGHSINVERLAESYRLTRAEGRLLKALLNGSNSLPEAASELGISKHTARSQFKSILEKTDTHSQTELIKKILTGPAALIGDRQETLAISDVAALEATLQTGMSSAGAQTLRLLDGRMLEYREYGDTSGRPVLFFHGCIHSRNKAHPFSNYAETNGIRIVVPERPGFGSTSLLPNEYDSDYYSRDIEQLLDHLEIDRAFVLSDASGAQAAFVSACFLPQRIKNVSVVSVYPEPRFDFPEKALKAERIMLKTYKMLPAIFHTHIAKIITRNLSRNPDNYFNNVMDQMPESDRSIITTPEHRAIVAESFINAYPDHIRGFVDDFMQRVEPWRFSIESCSVPVQIWHGTANSIVPVETAEKIAAALPDASLHRVEGGGHYIIVSHWDEILERLVRE